MKERAEGEMGKDLTISGDKAVSWLLRLYSTHLWVPATPTTAFVPSDSLLLHSAPAFQLEKLYSWGSYITEEVTVGEVTLLGKSFR